MDKATVLMALALAVGTSAGAYAREATGTIKSVNKKADAITLSDGKTYKLPEGIEAETLTPGEKVHITYSTSAGKTLVTNIQPAGPAGQ